MSPTEEDRMRLYREEAVDLARSIQTQAIYGPVILGPEMAKRVSAMLMQAEPPGNGLHCLRMGIEEGRAKFESPDVKSGFKFESEMQETAQPEPPPQPMEFPGGA